MIMQLSDKQKHAISTIDKNLQIIACAGSGKTGAVAHKMGRRWIGVEIGNHADTHIIPRMKKVLSGEDQGGISKSVEWKGGGSFAYYHLGASILSITEDGIIDLNWQLPVKQIASALLYYFGYKEATNLKYSNKNHENGFLVGEKSGSPESGEKAIVAIKNPQKDNNPVITELELNPLLDKIKKDAKEILIITNCALQAPQIKGLEILVKKVPTELVVEI